MSSNDLAIAAYRGDASAVRNLLTAYPEAINQKHTVWGRTPLMYACASGHLAIVQMLLEARPMLDVQDKFGETALMTAAESGLVAIVDRSPPASDVNDKLEEQQRHYKVKQAYSGPITAISPKLHIV